MSGYVEEVRMIVDLLKELGDVGYDGFIWYLVFDRVGGWVSALVVIVSLAWAVGRVARSFMAGEQAFIQVYREVFGNDPWQADSRAARELINRIKENQRD